MTKKILTVEDTFLIQGRGIVIAGIKEENFAEAKIGSQVEIVCPDGSKIFSEIFGIEFISSKCFSESNFKKSALLLRNIKKEDVVKGSEIFLVN